LHHGLSLVGAALVATLGQLRGWPLRRVAAVCDRRPRRAVRAPRNATIGDRRYSHCSLDTVRCQEKSGANFLPVGKIVRPRSKVDLPFPTCRGNRGEQGTDETFTCFLWRGGGFVVTAHGALTSRVVCADVPQHVTQRGDDLRRAGKTTKRLVCPRFPRKRERVPDPLSLPLGFRRGF
jgi:hypothetical protein